jgi:nucleoside-diphosphate-sugar epimerase
MTVLVTGGTGSVGINLVRHFAVEGRRVICFSRRATESAASRDQFLAPVRDRVVLVAGDVARPDDLDQVWRQYHPTHVVHAAAITPTPAMERALGPTIVAAHVMGTLNVLEAATRGGAQRVLYVSSAAVYGDIDERTPIREDARLDGDGLYSITKQTGEKLCARYDRLHGVLAVSVRVGWVYGPMERPMAGSREQMSLVYECVRLALQGEEIRLQELNAVRDWIYAGDLARAISILLFTDRLSHRVYNCAGPRGYRHSELLETLARVIPIRYCQADSTHEANIPSALTRRRRGPLSIDRLLADTRYRPEIDLETGLGLYLDWVRQTNSYPQLTSGNQGHEGD